MAAEDMLELVREYCNNDVVALEEVFNRLQQGMKLVNTAMSNDSYPMNQ